MSFFSIWFTLSSSVKSLWGLFKLLQVHQHLQSRLHGRAKVIKKSILLIQSQFLCVLLIVDDQKLKACSTTETKNSSIIRLIITDQAQLVSPGVNKTGKVKII